MDSAGNTRALPHVGFSIRRSWVPRLVSTSPALIAAAHALHRLLAPRHPPCALVLLIEKNTFYVPLWSFQGALGQRPKTATRAVSQNSAACDVEVDIVLGETVFRTAIAINGRSHPRSKSSEIP